MKSQRVPFLPLASIYTSIALIVVVMWITIMVFLQYLVLGNVPRWASDIEMYLIVLASLTTVLSLLIAIPMVLYDVFKSNRKVHPRVARGLGLQVILAILYFIINAVGLAVTGYIPY